MIEYRDRLRRVLEGKRIVAFNFDEEERGIKED